ncbi:hypothetical protein Patl1_02838 [Pistacia atlantica]|uniref:Uncharacterized protein n=1 Tax=Pistacia atlantica TaxID=434234 RepID=A0ACC1C4Q8_9ROSI|nr:hypothetical protein Patl1_02838 [Pistacia atlantica]
MAITVYYTAILLAFLSFLFKLHWSCNRNFPIRNWPVIGMVPGLLHNARRSHEYATQGLRQSGWTFNVKGPWEIFEALGNGIFNADGEMWKIQRKIHHSLLKSSKYESVLVRTIHKKVGNGLIPVLDHASKLGITLDIQEVFQRFTFDNICQLVLGFDPASLCVGFPSVEYEQAYKVLEEGSFYRQIVPVSYWKLKKWLQIGEEKKLSRAWRVLDTYLYGCISLKKEILNRRKANKEEEDFDLLTAFMKEAEEVIQDGLNSGNCLRITDEFLRDVAFNLIGAGRDTQCAKH